MLLSISVLVLSLVLFGIACLKLSTTSLKSRNQGLLILLIGSITCASPALYLINNVNVIFVSLFIPLGIMVIGLLLVSGFTFIDYILHKGKYTA